MEDYEQTTVIGAVFGIVITSLIFYLVLCSMCESEEFSLFGERFVRIAAEQEDEEMWCEEWVYEEYEKLSCKAAIKVDGDVLGAEPCGSGGQTCCRFYINESDVVENDKQDYRLCQDWHQECVSESLVRRRC